LGAGAGAGARGVGVGVGGDGGLLDAAAAVRRLCLSITAPGGEGGGGGTPPPVALPAALSSPPPGAPLPVLLLPAPLPCGRAGVRALARGALPLLHLPADGATLRGAAATPDLCSLVTLGACASGEGGPLALTRWRCPFGGRGRALALASATLPLGGAALRLLARGVAVMADEWRAVQGVLSALAGGLEERLRGGWESTEAGARAGAAARAHFPHAPFPLAAAELWSAWAVGASAGGALTGWLEGVGEPGLARAARSVEACLAAIEAVVVTRVAPAGELLLAGVAAPLLRGAPAHSALPPPAAVAALAEEVTAVLERAQGVRCAAAHARAVYSAFFLHLRLLLARVDGGGRRAAAAAGAAAAARGGAPPPAATSHLLPEDALLLQEALRPAALVAEGGGAQLSAPRAAAAGAPTDPLGLSFSFFGEDSGGGGSGGAPPAPEAPPRRPSAPAHDAFLPYSLALLLTRADTAEDEEGVAAVVGGGARAPAPAAAATAPYTPRPSLAAAAGAALARWRAIVGGVEAAASAAAAPEGPPLALPGGCGGAVLLYFDDRGPSAGADGGGVRALFPRGSYVGIFPVAEGGGAGGAPQQQQLLLLRLAPSGCGAAAALLQLPPGDALLGASPYGPLPGAVAAARAAAVAAGGGFVAAGAVGADGSRGVGLLLHTGGRELRLALLEARRVPLRATPPEVVASGGGGLLQWALAHAPRAPLSDFAARARTLGAFHAAPLAAAVAAAGDAPLECCGPRGVAVVALGAPIKRMWVVDLEEDEEEEGEVD
jgi:hypothetical protein